MSENLPLWLPDLIELKEFGGDWNRYLPELYRYFKRDFVISRPRLEGSDIVLKRYPVIRGFEASFWHLITSEDPGSMSDYTSGRLPDLRRCERIRWPRAIVEHANDPCVLTWCNERKGSVRTLLFVPEADYLLVLANRSGYLILWTGYTVERPHRKKKLLEEYERKKKV